MRTANLWLLLLSCRLASILAASLCTPGRGVCGTVVFRSPNYPRCCTESPPAGKALWDSCFFRIPLVLAVPRTSIILAFAEHRRGAGVGQAPRGGGCSDGSGLGLAMSRSIDGGATFGPVSYPVNDTDPVHIALHDGLVIGSAVFDDETNTTFLFYTACYHRCRRTQSYVLKSSDGGTTWSTPGEGNLTNVYEAAGIVNLQYGEGLGVSFPIQAMADAQSLNRGRVRLLVCSYFGQTPAHRNSTEEYDGIICISSDTHGKTWALAGKLASTRILGPLEPAIATLKNGSVLLNVRDVNRSHYRWAAISNDGGLSFSNPWKTAVIGPVSNAAMCTVGRGTKQEQVLLANPHSLEHRENLTVFRLDQATDEWSVLKQVYSGGSGYVTSTPAGCGTSELGLLFEADKDAGANCSSINYVRVNVSMSL